VVHCRHRGWRARQHTSSGSRSLGSNGFPATAHLTELWLKFCHCLFRILGTAARAAFTTCAPPASERRPVQHERADYFPTVCGVSSSYLTSPPVEPPIRIDRGLIPVFTRLSILVLSSTPCPLTVPCPWPAIPCWSSMPCPFNALSLSLAFDDFDFDVHG
jgi:hypothetical protein